MAEEHGTFSYLTAPNAATYRAVLLGFVAAKRRFTVHLRPEDVRDALAGNGAPGGGAAASSAAVADALEQLVEWGNLRADPDTSRVTTVEDFHRARFLYQLTHAGEAVEEALAVYDQALGRRGALQAVALVDIATQLRALLALAAEPEVDAAKAHLLLRSLVDRFSDLAGNARAFMGSLQRSLDLHDADAAVFLAYKDRLIGYLQRFIADLVTTGAQIAELIEALEAGGVVRLLDAAAAREASDVAPGAEDADAVRERAYAAEQERWAERWRGVHSWFLSAPGRPSQAKLLRAQARAAIPALLQVVAMLNERRTGRSDRSADFATLARWFAQAPDDAARHTLWRAAFGLHSARHLSIDADTLAAREARPVPPGTPWALAPPLQISPRLRRTGSYERRGKPNRVLDRTEARRHLAALAAAEAAQIADAREQLCTAGPARLSDLPALDAPAFGLFLGLLGDALGRLAPGRREVEVTAAAGTLAVRLRVLGDGRTAEIVTPHGVFRGPDHLVDIVDLTVDQRAERSA